jgi:molybdopterin-containing oxidoreductase family iron-sulfur binding subunit
MKHHVTNREYWRSLEELADGPEIRNQIEKEFPGYDPEEIVALSRRSFMRLMGASLAMAGVTLSGCRRWPQEKLAPYTVTPKGRLPGVTEQYASIMELGGVSRPLLVTSFDGRPIKIEGNPSHPFSATADKIGSADAMAQASVLELYDPDRSRDVVYRTIDEPRITDWNSFREALDTQLMKLRGTGGAGLAILSETTTSPTTLRLKAKLLAAMPGAKWYEYEALSNDNETAGARLAFGQPVRTQLHLDKTAVVVSFDADLLGTHPAHTRYAADWSLRRRSADEGQMIRLYLAETCLSITGTVADERLASKPSRLGLLMAALAVKLGVSGVAAPALSKEEDAFVAAAAADLKNSGNLGVVAVGAHLAPQWHHLGHAINQTLGAVGSTVSLLKLPGDDRPTHLESLSTFVSDANAGRINTLMVFGGNPVYDAPSDWSLTKAIASVPMSVRLGLYEDETSLRCSWHVPRAHYLESWGDGRAWDGSVSVQQPMIEPLYAGKSVNEMLALVIGEQQIDGDSLVRQTFAATSPSGALDENAYRRILHDGLQPASAAEILVPQARPVGLLAFVDNTPGSFEVRFQQSLACHDGRFANNGWLQEMPDPITKMTWDNPAYLSKKDADDLDVATGDMVSVTLPGGSMDLPVYVLPGQPIGVIGLVLGYGRTCSGNIGNEIGFNIYPLRTSNTFFAANGVTATKAGGSYKLAMTQNHYLIDALGFEEREERTGGKFESGKLIHETTLASFKADPSLFQRKPDGTLSLQLYNPPMQFNDPHAWGMAVDMNSCIGCNACVIACQAENNIPIVGKQQVLNNRQMHWIRVDRYFKGEPEDPNIEVVYQPLMCQHCENAPCEQVCPVAATVHDSEGLNTMVYNRCIGTRYCSNNCPYKVRRFNYLDWHSKDPRGWAKPWLNIPDTQQREMVDKIKRMVFNPDVTVRMRGVMEKCTYCVQRIHGVQIAKGNIDVADSQDNPDARKIHDGDIVTACQQACPTQAIVFGDLNDKSSKVSQLQSNNRAYPILSELNTRPRTWYLAKVRNPAESEQPA